LVLGSGASLVKTGRDGVEIGFEKVHVDVEPHPRDLISGLTDGVPAAIFI
jgi:hypothetical protein